MPTGASADSAPKEAHDHGSGDAPAQPASLPRILCVDDEPAILAMLERALRSQYQVVVQSDPDAALALVEHGRFAVVISDMRMPGMSGEAFLERVKKLDPHSTRLALTGGLDWQLPSELAFGILTKPITLPLLRATVSAAVQCHALAAPAESVRPSSPDPIQSSARAIAAAPTPFVESAMRPRVNDTASEPSAAPALVRTRGPAIHHTGQVALSLLGARVELWPRATLLGQATDCDIVVRDGRLAPRHLRFFSSWRGVTVQDVSGTTSARLNGEALDRVRFVHPGDCIDLGLFAIRVEALDA